VREGYAFFGRGGVRSETRRSRRHTGHSTRTEPCEPTGATPPPAEPGRGSSTGSDRSARLVRRRSVEPPDAPYPAHRKARSRRGSWRCP